MGGYRWVGGQLGNHKAFRLSSVSMPWVHVCECVSMCTMKNTPPVWKARMKDKVGVDKITSVLSFCVCGCLCVCVCVSLASHLKDTPGGNSYSTFKKKKKSQVSQLSYYHFPFLLFPVAKWYIKLKMSESKSFISVCELDDWLNCLLRTGLVVDISYTKIQLSQKQ